MDAIIFAVSAVLIAGVNLYALAGIDINLWTGIAMLVFGLLMLLWLVLRPSAPVAGEHDAEDGRPGHG